MPRLVSSIWFLLLCGLMPFSAPLALTYAVAGANPPTDYSFSDAEASDAYYNDVATNGLNQGGVEGYSEFFVAETGEDILDFFGASGVQQSAMRSGYASGMPNHRGAAVGYGALTAVSIVGSAIPGEGKVGTTLVEDTTKGIEKLVAEGITPTREGLINISQHLSTVAAEGPEFAMYSRLTTAFENGEKLTGTDAAFYQHELIESSLVDSGMEQSAAHVEALSQQGIPYNQASQAALYHPSVIQQFPDLFNSATRASAGVP